MSPQEPLTLSEFARRTQQAGLEAAMTAYWSEEDLQLIAQQDPKLVSTWQRAANQLQWISEHLAKIVEHERASGQEMIPPDLAWRISRTHALAEIEGSEVGEWATSLLMAARAGLEAGLISEAESALWLAEREVERWLGSDWFEEAYGDEAERAQAGVSEIDAGWSQRLGRPQPLCDSELETMLCERLASSKATYASAGREHERLEHWVELVDGPVGSFLHRLQDAADAALSVGAEKEAEILNQMIADGLDSVRTPQWEAQHAEQIEAAKAGEAETQQEWDDEEAQD